MPFEEDPAVKKERTDRVRNWYDSTYGKGGSHEHAPYFYGKPHLLEPLIESINNNKSYLSRATYKDLIEYVNKQAGMKLALNFEDIVKYRANDIENLLEDFFRYKKIDYQDRFVQAFVHRVLKDVRTLWEENEFLDVNSDKYKKENPSQPVVSAPPAKLTQPTVTPSMRSDIIQSILNSKDLFPKGTNPSEVLDYFLPLLNKSIPQKTASTIDPKLKIDQEAKLNTMMVELDKMIDQFEKSRPNPQEWMPFTIQLKKDLKNKWTTDLGIKSEQPIGTLKGFGDQLKANPPRSTLPKTLIDTTIQNIQPEIQPVEPEPTLQDISPEELTINSPIQEDRQQEPVIESEIQHIQPEPQPIPRLKVRHKNYADD